VPPRAGPLRNGGRTFERNVLEDMNQQGCFLRAIVLLFIDPFRAANSAGLLKLAVF
jgi:hypothetical protein